MATKTFETDTRVVEAPLSSVELEEGSQLTIKVKDNNTGTYLSTKTVSAESIIDLSGDFEVDVDGAENPYSLKFYKNSLGEVFPKNITYEVYERIKIGDQPEERILVARFSVNAELQNGDFKYYISQTPFRTDRISINFGGKQAGIRYNEGNSISLNVTSLKYATKLEKTISISYTDQFSGKEFNKLFVKSAIKNSIEDNLAIEGQTTQGAVELVNQTLSESERFLKFGVITDEGDNLVVTNWVDGGNLNQVDTEIEPLGSLVLELYNPATPLEIKDKVIFTRLYSDDIIMDVDLGVEVPGEGLRRLTPNFQKEVEENTISTFDDYQSFNELTLSGSSIQERIIDYFLQKKQDEVGLNTDFTNFNEFVKFGSAKERLVNFRYKIQQLEDLTAESASLASSSVSSSAFGDNRLERISDKIRGIKNGFDEYEQFLFNDSGSIYEDKPFASASANILASWPKTTSTEEISGFTSTKVSQSQVVSQSLDLDIQSNYVLSFNVNENGLPLSFIYNGKTIFREKTLISGSNEFEFSTRELPNDDDLLVISGADYGNTNVYTSIDGLSIKKKPQLKDSTSTDVVDWYKELREVAENFDARNKDSLKNNTPSYILNDDQNDEYILFLDMIGQMFDEIWLYGNELETLYDWNNDIAKGLSEDLSIVLLEAYGNNLDIGFSEKDVWEYVLGLDDEENELAKQVGFSFERRQKETIRRLLVNLPYFLKHKGTSRSIKGLILSYGIPLSTVFIREYGTFQGSDGLETIFTRETETKKLFMSGSTKSISLGDSELITSNAIEFNFQFADTSGSNVRLVDGFSTGSNAGPFNIFVSESNGSGSIGLSISSGSGEIFEVTTSLAPIYNGEFWNVLVQQVSSGSYEIRAYQFNRDDGTFEHEFVGFNTASALLQNDTDNTFNNGDHIEFLPFNGYLDEFRVWDTEISDAVFREHVKFPTSIKLDDPLQIPDKLLMRVDIETNTAKYIAEGEDRLPNLVFNPQYATQVTASNFVVDDFVTYTRTDYINSTNVGNEKLGNNKIRYQVTQSLNGGVLTPNTDFEERTKSNETISDIEDSYKLTIGFSPTDITNEIILQHFGGNDLLDEFGDPTNTYNDSYAELRQTVENFFENISSNNKTKFYIEYIRNFDKTLFDNIKKFVPERADLSTAIFIEPHFLDRSKAKRLGQSETEDLFKKGRDIQTPYEVSSTSNTEENTSNPLTLTDEEIWVGELLSGAETLTAATVISESEVLDYLNQSTNVVILNDGFESQVLQNNIWEEDSSIQVVNRHGESFRFKVYKFDYSTRLAELEAEIGAYLANNPDLEYIDSDGNVKYEPDEGYRDLTREWDKLYTLHETLFLLDYDANPLDNSVLVTYEDLPYWLKRELVLSTSTTQVDKTVTKNGVTYELSDDTIDGGSVVEVTRVKDTTTKVTDPDGDIKLTVE